MKRYPIRSTRSAMLLPLGSLLLSGRLDRASLRRTTPSSTTCMWMDRNRRPQGAVVDTGNAITPKRHAQGVYSGIPSWRTVGQRTVFSLEEYL
jgi:hypothetical protein